MWKSEFSLYLKILISSYIIFVFFFIYITVTTSSLVLLNISYTFFSLNIVYIKLVYCN